MDLFEAICEGLGLAIAVGLLIGVVVPPVMPNWGVVAGSAPLGVIAAGAALHGADEAVWPALFVGVIGAGLAGIVARDVASGAIRREQDQMTPADVQAPSGVTAIFVFASIAVAGISLFLPYFSLVALAALVWLWFARRRRAERKHEGLRVLR